LNYPPKRKIEPDNFAGFFDGGKELFALPMTRFIRGHRFSINIALNILPIAFEILTLKFILECFEYFGHDSLPPS
jgi:hypothetical protein